MKFSALLGVRPGVTAIVGSGGKTTLLARLAREAPGRVVVCTTTHMRPFAGMPLLPGDDPVALEQALRRYRVVCLGAYGGDGKLGAPILPIETLAPMADYFLVEADGARGLPLKAHAPHEPAVPAPCRQVICLAGASGFGQRVEKAVHRWEIFCRLTGAGPETAVTPALLAKALLAEGLGDTVFLNQVDTPADWALAETLFSALSGSGAAFAAGSLRAGRGRLFSGRG